jgi:hypothetical protein
MRAAGRFGVYGVLGYGIEVCYTAAKDLLTGRGDARLRGESYVWMAPIYGMGGLAGELVHARMRDRSLLERAAAYACTFWAVEAATGEVLRRTTGDVPWGEDYRRHRDNVGNGLIRLSYAPSWAAAGFALELISPYARRLRLDPAPDRSASRPA